MLGEDVLDRTVAELAPEIRARRISPVELTESYLDRIAALNPRLHAYETVTADVARREARQAEAEIKAGKYRGPLHGIPYGAKDLLATAGIRTTWGAAPLREQTFDFDATVIQKLRAAGAILLGKTAMIEFAGGLGYRWADASVSGATVTPWDTSRWSGGSSSGSGAAVAARLCAFAIGTETWGSILCPAAFNGITGLRPTYGRVSRHGAMVCAWSFDKIGPMARSAADCRIVLRAIAGADPNDASTEPVAWSNVRRRPSQIRAARIPLDFTKFGEPEVKAAFDASVAVFRDAGMTIEDAKLPDLPASEVAGLLIGVEAIAAFEPFFKDGRVKQLSDVYAPFQPEINAKVRAEDVMKAWRIRTVMQEKMAEFFQSFDVILSPNFMSVAPPIDKDFFETLPYPDPVGALGNACGLPAIALPSGFGKGGLPTSVQLMAAPWDEDLLVDLAEDFQRRTAHHRARPPIAAAWR